MWCLIFKFVRLCYILVIRINLSKCPLEIATVKKYQTPFL